MSVNSGEVLVARSSASENEPPIGEVLRQQRVNVLKKGLREMAALLGISPAYVTGIEKGTRKPAEELMLKIAQHYRLDVNQLRVGWQRTDAVVGDVANQDTTTAEKVPEFLRTARNLSPAQWDRLIQQAKKMTKNKGAQK